MRKRKALHRRTADVDAEPHGGNERSAARRKQDTAGKGGIAAEIKKGVTITRNAFI